MCIGTGLFLVFICPKFAIFGVIVESNHLFKTVTNDFFLAGTCSFSRCLLSNSLNNQQQNGVIWKDMIEISTIYVEKVWQELISIWLFIDSWCSNSKKVNHISDDDFKYFLAPASSNYKSKCFAKLRFVTVFLCFLNQNVWRRLISYSVSNFCLNITQILMKLLSEKNCHSKKSSKKIDANN